jgi:hypothetical protein
MRTIATHDLRTGAAFLLPENARCVRARAEHLRRERDSMIDGDAVDATEIRHLGSLPPGSIVYAEWAGEHARRWMKLRLV